MSDGGVVMVTGVGQGFGRAVALGWGRTGYDVVCADHDVDLASKTAAEVEDAGGQAIPIQIDVTLPLDVNLAFSKVDELFGRINGIVHVATRKSGADALTLADAEFAELLDETLRSTHLMLRTAGRRLQRGFVVVVAPPTSAKGPHNGMVRGGLRALVEGYDERLPGLRVNLVVPSRPASDPKHDAVLVEGVMFLAGSHRGGVHGATLHIDLPPPPRVQERLLPEIQAALDDRVRQSDLEASYEADEDDLDDEEFGDAHPEEATGPYLHGPGRHVDDAAPHVPFDAVRIHRQHSAHASDEMDP